MVLSAIYSVESVNFLAALYFFSLSSRFSHQRSIVMNTEHTVIDLEAKISLSFCSPWIHCQLGRKFIHFLQQLACVLCQLVGVVLYLVSKRKRKKHNCLPIKDNFKQKPFQTYLIIDQKVIYNLYLRTTYMIVYIGDLSMNTIFTFKFAIPMH